MKSKIIILLEIFLLFIVLPLLLFFGIVPFQWWPRVLEFGLILAVLISIFHKTSLKELGLRTDNLKESLVCFGGVTFFGILALLLLRRLVNYQTSNAVLWWQNPFVYYMVFLNDPIQEFIYRGFLMERIKKLFCSPVLVIATNIIIFAFVHIIFRDPYLLIFVFISGLVWAWAYYKYPNVFAVALSHAILGGVAMILGLT